MGWWPVNKIEVRRVFEPKRLIIVSWVDDVTGYGEKAFEIEDTDEAIEFAKKKINELAM